MIVKIKNKRSGKSKIYDATECTGKEVYKLFYVYSKNIDYEITLLGFKDI